MFLILQFRQKEKKQIFLEIFENNKKMYLKDLRRMDFAKNIT